MGDVRGVAVGEIVEDNKETGYDHPESAADPGQLPEESHVMEKRLLNVTYMSALTSSTKSFLHLSSMSLQ